MTSTPSPAHDRWPRPARVRELRRLVQTRAYCVDAEAVADALVRRLCGQPPVHRARRR